MGGNKYVILHDNMLDEHDMKCFDAFIPYLIEDDSIYNGDEMIVELVDIWVEYHVENEEQIELRTYIE